MKRCIYFLFFYFALSVGFAQDSLLYDSREYIALGFKAGLNVSDMYDCNREDFESKAKTGFAAGLFVALPIGKYLGIQPEVVYSQRGFRGSGAFQMHEYDLDRTLSYLDFPLLAALKPTEGISILFGPQYSFLINQHDSFSNSNLTSDEEEIFKTDNIKKHAFCLTGGLDFNLQNIVLGLRTGWDLTNNKTDRASETPCYKNIWLQGTVGFRVY